MINKTQALIRVDTIKIFLEHRITFDDISHQEMKSFRKYIEGLKEIREYISTPQKTIVIRGLGGLILVVKSLFSKRKI
jgi:hypothetical protein